MKRKKMGGESFIPILGNQLVTEESDQEKICFTYNQQGSMINREGASGISRFFYNSNNQPIQTEMEDDQRQEN